MNFFSDVITKEVMEYTIKDKFSYIYNGYTQNCIIDKNNTIFSISHYWYNKDVMRSMYYWNIANKGDIMKVIKTFKNGELEKIEYELISNGGN